MADTSPGFRLSCSKTALARFDAVVNGVAQHVLERRHDTLEDAAVEFAFHLPEFEFDMLVEFRRDLPHHAPDTGQDAGEGHHA